MDHRISKDMISSGMIPSGEKKQEDLSRTQYGTAPSPNALSDVYKKMYETKEEVINEHHQKDKDGNTIPHEGEEVKEENINELKTRTMLNYIDKASDSASKQLDKANKTTSRKKEVKARLKMDSRERGIEMAKDKIMKRVKEDADLFDVISSKLIEEGYSKKESYKIMTNLTEEQLEEINEAIISGTLAALGAIGGKLASGAAVAGKAAMGAVKAGGAALKSGMKGVVSAAKGGVSSVKSGMKGVTNAAKNVTKQKVTSSGGKIEQGSSDTGGNKIMDFAKREAGFKVRQELTKDREGSVTNKTKQTSAPTTTMAASADLFDIVKGQLLDEGLSEEDIKDIMLTLTPDEILKEIEESSMSGGTAGGAYQDLGPGGFRSKEQINTMHNDPKGTEKYGKKIMKRVGQAVKDTGTPTVKKVDESKK